jgi:hypothetical protein
MEKTNTLLMHDGGLQHPACKNCVRRWSIQHIDHPTCALCRSHVNLEGVLSPDEIQNYLYMKEIDMACEKQNQVESDENMAREILEREIADIDKTQIKDDHPVHEILEGLGTTGICAFIAFLYFQFFGK